MSGSVRQRGVASWELRVYSGIDPDTGKRHYRTATVVGNRSDADRGLTELVASVRSKRSICSVLLFQLVGQSMSGREETSPRTVGRSHESMP